MSCYCICDCFLCKALFWFWFLHILVWVNESNRFDDMEWPKSGLTFIIPNAWSFIIQFPIGFKLWTSYISLKWRLIIHRERDFNATYCGSHSIVNDRNSISSKSNHSSGYSVHLFYEISPFMKRRANQMHITRNVYNRVLVLVLEFDKWESSRMLSCRNMHTQAHQQWSESAIFRWADFIYTHIWYVKISIYILV